MIKTKNQPAPVYTLDSIRPTVDTKGLLHYSSLEGNAAKYAAEDWRRIQLFYNTPEGSVDEERCARELASSYLIQTAQHQVRSHLPEVSRLWADRYTEASIELYGEPNPLLANYLLIHSLHEYSHAAEEGLVDPLLLDKYRNTLIKLGINSVESSQEGVDITNEATNNASNATKAYIENKYKLDAIKAGFEGRALSPDDIKKTFEELISSAQGVHPELKEWCAVLVNSEIISVSPRRRRIEIGQNRVSASYEEVIALFVHEVLVHVVSTINGEKYSEIMQYGLPGYESFQEGLGIWMECARTGKLPIKSKNRYIDISIALGLLGKKKIPKKDLLELITIREEMLAGVYGTDIDDAVTKANSQVNRIYRGTKGDDTVGVFTKDIIYLDGYIKVANYICAKLEEGYSIERILEYLLSGKFDPTNVVHTRYVNEKRTELGEDSIR